MKRFYYDLNGAEDLSIDAIDKLHEQAKHIYSNVDEYYYRNREDGMKD